VHPALICSRATDSLSLESLVTFAALIVSYFDASPNRTLFNPARAMQGLDAMQRVPMSTNQSYWVDKVTAYEEEQTMKFVVLGATGGIGVETVRQAIEHGHSVTAFVRSPERLKSFEARRSVE
jgi:hypothetical protein